jgi:hypothetical protein
MNKIEILKEIKNLIFSNKEEKELNFKDSKANDGEIIVRVEADEFEVGLPLFVITEDGLIQAPAGKHTLEDGRIVEVNEEGVIVSIETPEVEEEVETPEAEIEVELGEEKKEEMEEEKEEEKKEEMEEEKKEVEVVDMERVIGLEKRIEELESIIKDVLETSKEVASFSSQIGEKLNSVIDEMPADKEIKKLKSESFSSERKNKINDSLESIKNIRNKK